MYFGLTKPRWNFLATTKGIFEKKKGETFVENNTLPTVEVDPLCFGVVWHLGAQAINKQVEGRMDSAKYQEIL